MNICSLYTRIHGDECIVFAWNHHIWQAASSMLRSPYERCWHRRQSRNLSLTFSNAVKKAWNRSWKPNMKQNSFRTHKIAFFFRRINLPLIPGLETTTSVFAFGTRHWVNTFSFSCSKWKWKRFKPYLCVYVCQLFGVAIKSPGNPCGHFIFLLHPRIRSSFHAVVVCDKNEANASSICFRLPRQTEFQ